MDILRDLSDCIEYVPGRGPEEVAREHGLEPDDLAKLASNENPLGPPPSAVEAIREKASGVNVYPTSLHEDVRKEVAESIGAPRKNVVLGPGADGVFDTVGRAILEEGDAVFTPSPGFSYYGMSARNLGAKENSYALRKREDFSYSADRVIQGYGAEKITYVTSPNNPTGTTLTIDEIEKIADGIDGLLTVDEAYHEFSDRETAIPLALERDDVAVARTFSKAYGLAGLRAGFGVFPEEIASAYRKVVTPFCVGSLPLCGVSVALNGEEHLKETLEVTRWGREYMEENLEPQTFPSEANFVLLDVSPHDASDFAEALEKRGIIVRDATSFGLEECIRVSVGTREETRRAVREINELYRTKRTERQE